MARVVVLAAALLTVGLCVGFHAWLFSELSVRLPKLRIHHRNRVVLGILAAMAAHLIEIGVFTVPIALIHHVPASWALGQLQGVEHGLTDFFYASALSYTTLGFEGIEPVGHIRLFFGVEALAGLVLVAWTASFTYLQMDKYWSEHGRK